MRITVQRLRSLLSEAIDASLLPTPIPCPIDVETAMEMYVSELNGLYARVEKDVGGPVGVGAGYEATMTREIPRELNDWFDEKRSEAEDEEGEGGGPEEYWDEFEQFTNRYAGPAVSDYNGYRVIVWNSFRGVIEVEESASYHDHPVLYDAQLPSGDITLDQLREKVFEVSLLDPKDGGEYDEN